VGAQEQLARYAAILGVPFQAFESLEGLNLAMTGDASWKGLILIDTPGLAPADLLEIREFEAFFVARQEIEKHMVLRASERAADLLLAISRFSALQPSRLLFTGLDESAGLSGITETLVKAEIPCSFGGTGQRIPEDLYEMDVASLVRRFAESLTPAPAKKTNTRAAGASG
jgi:flagellar biosynthesis GTPase FlhF